MRLPGYAWRTIHRTQNRWYDLIANLTGYCNNSPWTPRPSGGYSFWRCALRGGHDSAHRARNYTWEDHGNTQYAPVSNGAPMPSQPRDRKPSLTLRQARHSRDWVASQHPPRVRR